MVLLLSLSLFSATLGAAADFEAIATISSVIPSFASKIPHQAGEGRAVTDNEDAETSIRQECGYITGNPMLPLGCDTYSYCHGASGWLGCCKTMEEFSTIETNIFTVTTIIATAPLTTETRLSTASNSVQYYSANDCTFITSCYPLRSLSLEPDLCTGECASNPGNLLW
jgi:hypothetical protein